MSKEWKTIENAAQVLQKNFGEAPKIAVVLGSGLGTVVDRMEERSTLATSEVEGWPESTVEGHAGALHVGSVQGKKTLVMQGRVHLYEGYSPAQVVRPMRTAVAWGAEVVILTNAAGGLDPGFKAGQLMVIEDHLNLTGHNPLVGPADVIPGPRFPDLSGLYDRELRRLASVCATKLGIFLESGVYAGMLGPSYETAAEVKMLSGLGARAVGMSTVLEAIAARHLGARVVGFSTITNLATGLEGAVLDHDHVQLKGAEAAEDLGSLLEKLIAGADC